MKVDQILSRPLPQWALSNFLENYDRLPERLLTSETAQILGVETSTLHVWASTGRTPELVYSKIGRQKQYHKFAIKTFILNNTFRHSGMKCLPNQIEEL